MTNKLLGIIAINLTIITGLMVLQSIPTATAQSGVQKIAICDELGTRCARISVNAPGGVSGGLMIYN
tara:strand:- start:412 stop:612 length:201 start_codon:yes stop_codon:yes gene_type:complete